jgi:hypothetical protein
MTLARSVEGKTICPSVVLEVVPGLFWVPFGCSEDRSRTASAVNSVVNEGWSGKYRSLVWYWGQGCP